MTITVAELQSSGGYDIDSDGRKSSREFLVYTDDQSQITLIEAAEQNSIPSVGDPHPESGTMYCNSLSSSYKSDTGGDVVIVTASYSTGAKPDDNEEDDIFVRISSRGSSSFLDTWRTGADIPQNPSSPGTGDIAGVHVDVGGNPISTQVVQVTLETGFPVEGAPNFQTLVNAIGTRNSSEFLGFPKGSLLYVGPSVDRIGINTYSRKDSFLYDNYFHCRQAVNSIDEDGRPVLDSDSTAEAVMWVQPFPNTSNFFSLGIPV